MARTSFTLKILSQLLRRPVRCSIRIQHRPVARLSIQKLAFGSDVALARFWQRRRRGALSMIFDKRFRSDEHTRAFVVAEADERGWEVREEEDNEVIKRAWLHDWKRVESTMLRFAIRAMQMQSSGWTEVHTPVSTVV
jgi:hypothetical protein